MRGILSPPLGGRSKKEHNDKSEKRIEIGRATPHNPVESLKNVDPHHPSLLSPAILHVRDNGIGIAAEQQPAVFEIFRRLHNNEEYGGGTGTGLTIVKTDYRTARGCIWLESTPGAGTTFFFTLAPEG